MHADANRVVELGKPILESLYGSVDEWREGLGPTTRVLVLPPIQLRVELQKPRQSIRAFEARASLARQVCGFARDVLRRERSIESSMAKLASGNVRSRRASNQCP